jgi:hypothetical protein
MAGRLHKISTLDIYIYHKVFHISLVPSSSTGNIKVKKYDPFTSQQLLLPPTISEGTFYKEFLTQLMI